jgi:hypothetical protein
MLARLMMRYVLLILSLLMASCATRSAVFNSPTDDISLSYISKDTQGLPIYRISTKDGRELGQIKSIIDAETVKNVPGLPVEQEVIWSSTGRTALVYENMSDASPNYQHVLICLDPDLENYRAYKLNLGIRFSLPGSYGYWPSVSRITDFAVELNWSSEPKNETVEFTKLLADPEKIEE